MLLGRVARESEGYPHVQRAGVLRYNLCTHFEANETETERQGKYFKYKFRYNGKTLTSECTYQIKLVKNTNINILTL